MITAAEAYRITLKDRVSFFMYNVVEQHIRVSTRIGHTGCRFDLEQEEKGLGYILERPEIDILIQRLREYGFQVCEYRPQAISVAWSHLAPGTKLNIDDAEHKAKI